MRVNFARPFVFLLVLIVLVSLACRIDLGGGTATPAAASSAEPGQLTQGTAMPVGNAEKFFTEEWDGDISHWSKSVELNAKEGDTSQAKIFTENGRLVFDFGAWLIGYMFYDPYTYTNVRVDVRADNRGSNVNNVLLVCRVSDEGHYLANIANSGLFAMYAYDGSNKSYVRLADGGSNKIKSGKEINDYSLVCKDRMLILYINGFDTRKYTDNQFVFKEGKVGVGVASEDKVPVKVEFESVTISEP